MKVCLSVPGRFHGFDLARELNKRGVLDCLITSYPKYKTVAYGIDKSRVKSIFGKEFIIRGWHFLFGYYPEWFWLNEWYDLEASKVIPNDADIYILWAGFASKTISRIRMINPEAKIILERGSVHIEEQKRLLNLVQDYQSISSLIIEKEKKEYELVDFISVPGRFSSKSFTDKGVPIDKIFINPYGVNLSLFSEKKIDSKLFTVGYVGSISKQKNVSGIISSINILIQKGYKIELLLAGDIDKNSYSQDFLAKHKFISYMGRLPQEDLPKIYSKMDAFVLNSVQDGFGMVLLQAMSMQVTPIATYNTGGPDLINDGDNGFLIPILDDNFLAARLELLINNVQLRKVMEVKARKTVINGYSWSDYGQRYILFLNQILRKNY